MSSASAARDWGAVKPFQSGHSVRFTELIDVLDELWRRTKPFTFQSQMAELTVQLPLADLIAWFQRERARGDGLHAVPKIC
ncbi:hypothetical protein CQW44_30775 [Streptomyces griseofuscus]|uniref:Uncharacterized protein n=1 Tax=Streptomyces griseofuscus TaxID=146922 RepID=A0A3R8WP12_9ACTN|nr:hypothetical protein CQW44_30775 [Streptomyces griseofuscus]